MLFLLIFKSIWLSGTSSSSSSPQRNSEVLESCFLGVVGFWSLIPPIPIPSTHPSTHPPTYPSSLGLLSTTWGGDCHLGGFFLWWVVSRISWKCVCFFKVCEVYPSLRILWMWGRRIFCWGCWWCRWCWCRKLNGECGLDDRGEVTVLIQENYLCSVRWELGGGTLHAAISGGSLVFPNLHHHHHQLLPPWFEFFFSFPFFYLVLVIFLLQISLVLLWP
jgi:hypothetical protein